jgi:hypothetical protein
LSPSSFEESDPRDKVYAILDMTNTPTESQVEADPYSFVSIDYKKTLAQLYQDVTKYLINSRGTLDIILYVESRKSSSLALPTWTPDWGKISYSNIPYGLANEITMEGALPEMQRQLRPEKQRHSEKLIVYGYAIGTVSKMARKTYNPGFSRHLTADPGIEYYETSHLGPERIAFDVTIHKRIICKVLSKREFFNERQFTFEACVPLSARTGDVIVVFPGATLPFVLRRIRGEEYHLHEPATRLLDARGDRVLRGFDQKAFSQPSQRLKPDEFVLL